MGDARRRAWRAAAAVPLLALLLSGCTLIGELRGDPLEQLGLADDGIEVVSVSPGVLETPITELGDGVIDGPRGDIRIEAAARSTELTSQAASDLGLTGLGERDVVHAPGGQEFRIVELSTKPGAWPQVGISDTTDYSYWVDEVSQYFVETELRGEPGNSLSQQISWGRGQGYDLTLLLLADEDAAPDAATLSLEIDGKVQRLSLITGELLDDAQGSIGTATGQDFALRSGQGSEDEVTDPVTGTDIVTGEVIAEYGVLAAPYSQAIGWPGDGETYVGVQLQVRQYYQSPDRSDLALPVRHIVGTLTLDDGTEVDAVLIEPTDRGPGTDGLYQAWFPVPADFAGGDLSFEVAEGFPRTDDLNSRLDHTPFTARLEVVA